MINDKRARKHQTRMDTGIKGDTGSVKLGHVAREERGMEMMLGRMSGKTRWGEW